MKPDTNTLIIALILLSASTVFSYAKNIEQASLSKDEIESLTYMREEEKLAHDVYVALYEKWKNPIFNTISESEQRHMDAILQLLNKYDLPDPAGNKGTGVFTNTRLQELYNQLVERGSRSMKDALKVGITIEDLDIFDLTNAMSKINHEDIKMVYDNLNRASRNHLRSFYSNILSAGETYTPQYISRETFDAIISSPVERGKENHKGGGNHRGKGKN